MMLCPRCKVELRTGNGKDSGAVVIEVYPSCNGSWFEKGNLDRSDGAVEINIEEDVQFFPATGEHEILQCPKCASDLRPLTPRGIEELVVGRCGTCEGFWLDDKELELIRKAVSQKHSEMVAQGDAKTEDSGSVAGAVGEIAVGAIIEGFFAALFS